MTPPLPNFLGLPVEETDYKKASVIVVPVPFEKTTSYMHGTAKGPAAMIEASHQVEFYDPELEQESFRPALHTVDPLKVEALEAKKALGLIEKEIGKILDDHKFPLMLGGEHTITTGAVGACAKRFPNLSILQIDAHADLRDTYENSPFSHACAMRRSIEYAKKLVGVGIRSVCVEEVEFARKHKGITLFYDHQRRAEKNWVAKAIDELTDTVYLTIDIDGFDPQLVPATGTPEPGGLSWYEGLELIRTLFQKKKVVAADVVELLPLPGAHASSFVAAKLAYKVVGYFKKFQKSSF